MKKILFIMLVAFYCFNNNIYIDASNIEKHEGVMSENISKISKDALNTNYSVKVTNEKNTVTYLENGINIVVYNKETGIITLNGEIIGNIVYENVNKILKASSGTLVRTFKGYIDISDVKTVAGIAAVIIARTGGFGWAIAVGIASSILSNKVTIKKIYYTEYIYKKKVENGRQGTKYKFTSKMKFYSDSKRTKHLGTIG